MKSFLISQTLIYNTSLKSQKKKPIQTDIQQAKILAYLPDQAPIQQKCNTVGMAQGVYEFTRTLLTSQQNQCTSKHMVIFMDNCCLVQKEFQQNTWVFLKLQYEQIQSSYIKFGEQPECSYIDNIITEQIALSILDHFYLSFSTFYGSINTFIAQKKLSQLQKMISYFVKAYSSNNRLQQIKKMDISSYLFTSIRALPMDLNSTLKFVYYKRQFENNLADFIVFNNGFLVHSTLNKQTTSFFQNYLYGTGQPFQFKFSSFDKKQFKLINNLFQISTFNNYGTLFTYQNTVVQTPITSASEIKLPNQLVLRKTRSSNNSKQRIISVSQQISSQTSTQPSQDQLHQNKHNSIAFPSVYILKNGSQQKYAMTYYIQKKMLFISFFKQLTEQSQILEQNSLYHSIIPEFNDRMLEALNSIFTLKDVSYYHFLYKNQNTFTGKSSIQKYNIFVPELRYLWKIIQKNKQALVATTIQNHWVYGIHRLSRILLLLIPIQNDLSRLDDFIAKMLQENFTKIYM